MTDFPLPAEDSEYLDATFPSRWKEVLEDDSNKRGIVISDYELPDGIYTPDKSDLMLIVPTDYPMSGIDMFYFSPDIVRKDGQSIAALCSETHFGRDWQRWSRHYEWKPGEHSIVSHLSYVQNQLKHD